MVLLGSIILKIIIYSLWCYLAIQYLSQDYKIYYANKFNAALKFGVIRIIIGLIISIPIWYLAAHAFPNNYANRIGMNLWIALLVLISIHLINWCIILRLMLSRIPFTTKVLAWIAGGIFISCVMDMILLISFQMDIGL